MQVCYNLIYQSAALHVLNEARAAEMGVTVMRPMTSGILQHIAGLIAPEWQQSHDIYDASLRFVLSDSRVHVANVGMRWPHEIERNIALVRSLQSSYDMAAVPRMTIGIYQSQDAKI